MAIRLNPNIKIDKLFADKIAANDLNCVDCFKLATAQLLCEQFPQAKVHLVPQQQTKPISQIPPAVFVQVFELHKEERLGSDLEWEIAANIAYMSKNKNAETEQIEAAMKIMDKMRTVPPLEGMEYPYTMYVSDSETVDGIVNVTGTVKVWERRPDDAPLIEIADTNVNIKELEEENGGCS